MRVLALIRERHPEGITDDEIEVVLGLSHQTASARRRDLVNALEVVDSGRLRPTRTGSPAHLWVLARTPPPAPPPPRAPAPAPVPVPPPPLPGMQGTLFGDDDS